MSLTSVPFRRRASQRRRVLLTVLTVATAGSAVAGAYSYGADSTTDPVIVAAGDIACAPTSTVNSTACQQPATGKLVQSLNPVAVLPLGDTQYDNGTSTEYASSYDVTGWGADKGISRPAVGNHEYQTAGATGYYGYFGTNAGDPSKGYYSYDISGPNNSFQWHLIALNSECATIGGGSTSAGCGVGSPQEQWLKADLAAHPNVCTLAYFHRPRFSSGATVGSSTTYTAFWNDLYAAGADVVLNGHAHHYERFAPQTSSGALDTAKGITEFIVGTGGKNFQSMSTTVANSVVRNNTTFGVLKLTLHASSYSWQFVPVPGATFTDSGTAACHSASAPDTTAPSSPTNLTASASSSTQVDLGWTASTDNVGVSNYRIYRGANGATPSLLATTSTASASYSDTSAQAATSYTYQVSALDAAGNESAPSAVATATTPPAAPDSTPPTAPGSVSADAESSTEIDVSWTASTDTGTGVAGYRVYREMAGDASFTLVGAASGSALGYADTTVSPGTSYAYYVTAYDGAGNESAPSATVTASTPAGSSSQTFTFPPAADASIDQTNSTTNYGSSSSLIADAGPVDDFLIRFSVSTPGCTSLTSATMQLTNTDGSTKGGDFYTTGSNWSESAVSWSTAPTRGTLVNSLGAVAVGSTYGVNVTGGVALNGDASFRVSNTTSDGARYYSKEGGSASQKPTLTVVCATSGTADTTAPTAPANLTAKAVSSSEIDLSWSAATDNIGVTGYKIYRSDTAAEVGTVSGSSLTYQDTTVAAATTYSYTVKAFDAAGNLSADSNTASATAPAAPPPAPVGLVAAANGSEVDLVWTPSGDATVTGYDVYRGPHRGTLAKVGSTASAAFADMGLRAGSYDYAVTAVATGGTESARSAVATATVGVAFGAAADATIDQKNATRNYGSATSLVVDGKPVDNYLLSFNVILPACTTVSSAVLTLTDSDDGSVKGGDFFTAGAFTESTVTWSTAPAKGTPIGSLGGVSTGRSYSLDVTSAVSTVGGQVTFRVSSTSNDAAHYYSKEGAGTDPTRAPTLTVLCS